jgi:sugar phosphate isomerase/epimerase
LGSAALATAKLSPRLLADSPAQTADPYRGLKMGVASYSLRKFTLDQALAMTRELGLKYICLKDVHLPLSSSPAECRAARDKVAAAGITLLGGGVITFRKPDEVRRVFEYAKNAGMPTIVASPDPELLDSIESMVKEFDIRLAIHNHGPGDKWYPSPSDALRAVENRDKRMGLCIDVGHTVRIGEEPVAAIQRCASRLYDFHIKDVSEATAQGKPVVLGTGIIDIPGVHKALLAVGFAGHLGLEYERDADDPMPGMQKSLAYIRESLAAIK